MLNRLTLSEALKAKPGCLTPEELEKLAEHSSPSHSHLADCPRCQAELALLKSFESSQPLPDEGAAVAWISAHLERQLDQIKHPGPLREAEAYEQPGGWLFSWFAVRKTRWLVPVAAALVVAVTGVTLIHRSREPQLRTDAGNGPVVYRSQEIEVTGPVGELADAPKTLQWKALQGAAEYKIAILEVDGVPLWSVQTGDSVVSIPGAIRAKMLPGKPVLWRVTALDSQGRVLAASQVQRFFVLLKSSGSPSGVVSR